MFTNNKYLQIIFIPLTLVLTYFAYLPGITGGFLFDDYQNLSFLGQNGAVSDWNSFLTYLASGFSGPTGRPISLISFLIDDNTWPSNASYFKTTNLLIHFINGILIGWASLLLLRLNSQNDQKAAWIALLSMSFWLLHPLFVSTTLYVVQRMAQLSTLFMFAGLISYFYGRLILSKKPVGGYILLSLGVAVGTVLATLSKENGALLPLLIVIIEFCIYKKKSAVFKQPDWKWRTIFLWLPSLVIISYLATRVDFSHDLWPFRDFNQYERLLTQSRIIWEYLYLLWVPTIEGRGFFQDGYIVSTNWVSPPITLIAVIGLFFLILAAIIIRKRYPLISLSILFFFGAHILESSVIGLELYFEHRNYTAAAFLFLPLAQGIVKLNELVRLRVVVLLSLVILILLSYMTWQRSYLWKNTEDLQAFWAINNPDSARGQHFIAMQLFKAGNWNEGMQQLKQAEARIPNNSLLSLQILMQKVSIGDASVADFNRAATRLAKHRANAETISNLRDLAEYLILHGSRIEIDQMIKLIQHLDEQNQYLTVEKYNQISPYLKGSLFLANENVDEAVHHLTIGIERHDNIEAAMAIVAMIASHNHPEEALKLLELAEDILLNQTGLTFLRPSALYRHEIDRFRTILLDDIKAKQLYKKQLGDSRNE